MNGEYLGEEAQKIQRRRQKLKEERLQREQKLEDERLQREQKLEEERLQREQKLEEERLQRKQKLEEERLQRKQQLGEERLQRKQQGYRKQLVKTLRRYYQKLCENCHNTIVAQGEAEETRELIANANKSYPEFAKLRVRYAVWFFLLLLFFPAVYSINFVLIRQPVEYLAQQAFPPGAWQVSVAVVALPLLLMAFEVGICAQLSLAKLDELRTEAEVKRWQRLASVIVWVTPIMVVATFLALYSGEYFPPPLYECLLLAALAILAYVTDAGVVFGSEKAQEALSFFWFRFHQAWRKWKVRDRQKTAFREGKAAEMTFMVYLETIKEHNDRFNDDMEPRPFNSEIRQVISERIGENATIAGFLKGPEE